MLPNIFKNVCHPSAYLLFLSSFAPLLHVFMISLLEAKIMFYKASNLDSRHGCCDTAVCPYRGMSWGPPRPSLSLFLNCTRLARPGDWAANGATNSQWFLLLHLPQELLPSLDFFFYLLPHRSLLLYEILPVGICRAIFVNCMVRQATVNWIKNKTETLEIQSSSMKSGGVQHCFSRLHRFH